MSLPWGLWGLPPGEQRWLLGRIADAGIDHVFTADHVSFRDGSGMDGLVTLAALSGLEPRLGLHLGVYLLALRHPMVAARQIATLAEAAPGRLTVGVGVGGDDRHEVEVCDVNPATRGRRTDVALKTVRALLDGHTVDGDGEFFEFRGGKIRPVPEPAVPFLVGGAAMPRSSGLAVSVRAGWPPGARPAGSPKALRESKRPAQSGTSNGSTACSCGSGQARRRRRAAVTWPRRWSASTG